MRRHCHWTTSLAESTVMHEVDDDEGRVNKGTLASPRQQAIFLLSLGRSDTIKLCLSGSY